MSLNLYKNILRYLDPHLALDIIDFLDENKILDSNLVLLLKIQTLARTKMYDYTLEIIEQLNPDLKSKDEIKNLQKEISEQKESTTKIIAGSKAQSEPLLNKIKQRLAELEAQKQGSGKLTFYFEERPAELTKDLIESAIIYSRYMYDAGDYFEALSNAQVLYYIVEEEEQKLNLLWGQLYAEILVEEKRDQALETIKVLKNKIDNATPSSHMYTLANRSFLIHAGLFLYFTKDYKEQDINSLIDLLTAENQLSAIQLACPYILRYLVSAVILSKSAQLSDSFNLNTLSSIIQKGVCNYSDCLTEFITAVFNDFDYQRARDTLTRFDSELQNDFFLKPHLEKLKNSCQYLIFETYSKMHNSLDIKMVQDYLGFSTLEEGEIWIINLLRSANIEAKIDSDQGIISIANEPQNSYEKILNNTRDLVPRTNILINNIKRLYAERK